MSYTEILLVGADVVCSGERNGPDGYCIAGDPPRLSRESAVRRWNERESWPAMEVPDAEE